MATEAEVCRFHDPAYVACLRRAERDGAVTPDEAARYRLGIEGNGLYPDVFRRPMTAAGGTLLACRLALREPGTVVHHTGGGTHHARRDRASGFCYLNDAVLGLLSWLDAGLRRVAYVDVDAHHGDGVEFAFAGDPRVLTISVHERDRWPRTGLVTDRAGGSALNLPVPPELNDTEMRRVVTGAVLPALDAFAPEAIILQCGADALAEDPQVAAGAVEQRAVRGGGGADGAAPAARGAGRGWLQPVHRGACLGGRVGHAERADVPRSTARGGAGHARRDRVGRGATATAHRGVARALARSVARGSRARRHHPPRRGGDRGSSDMITTTTRRTLLASAGLLLRGRRRRMGGRRGRTARGATDAAQRGV